MNSAPLLPLMEAMFPNYRERCASIYDWVDTETLGLRLQTDGNIHDGYTIIIRDRQLGNLLSFKLRAYPKCCGILMFYNFSAHLELVADAPELYKFLDAVFDQLRGEMWFQCGRVEVCMVERRDNGYKGKKLITGEDEKPPEYKEYEQQLLFKEILPIPDPVIDYKIFWNYFHTKWVRDRLMYNINSGHIIHNLEVIL